MAAPEPAKNAFLIRHREKEDFNQYWYSSHTISKIVQELLSCSQKAAFLSTPSVYFSLPKGSSLRQNSWVLDFDTQWASDPHFVKYDFNSPLALPADLHHAFDCVVIDPPFITREVWQHYAATARLLLQPQGGKVIASTVAENAPLMEELLGVKPVAFRPSIPHLVYQYNFFTSHEPSADGLGAANPEVPDA
ncbi:putative N6-adenine methyltransferase-domain-containing protein [Haematococcus lacustris]